MRLHFGWGSVSTAHHFVVILEKLGLLERVANHPRGMALTACPEMVVVPVRGTIAAGVPIENIEDNAETLAVPRSVLHGGGTYFALRVKGESMIDEDIHDRDVVVVREQPTANSGEKVVAEIDGEAATLKTLYYQGPKIRLQPANDKYEALFVDPDRVSIRGKVVCVVKSPKVMQSESQTQPHHDASTKPIR
jgi:repressor LexA